MSGFEIDRRSIVLGGTAFAATLTAGIPRADAQSSSMEPKIATTVRASLGEGPVWDEARGCLWFVDINAPALYRMNAETGVLSRYSADSKIGWALPAKSGKLLCGLQTGLHWFDPDTGAFKFWQAVEPDLPNNRLNDACADPQGRVFFGSMDMGGNAPSGRFYRLANSKITKVGPPAVPITNGPGISPDGKTIYFVDSTGRTIHVASIDKNGMPSTSRVFLKFTGDEGYPDGVICDAAGNVWIGMYAGWGARCYSPDGNLIHFVRFPVANVTKLAFGGPKRDRLYATTAAQGLDAAALAKQPNAGDLFTFTPPIGGFRTGVVSV